MRTSKEGARRITSLTFLTFLPSSWARRTQTHEGYKVQPLGHRTEWRIDVERQTENIQHTPKSHVIWEPITPVITSHLINHFKLKNHHKGKSISTIYNLFSDMDIHILHTLYTNSFCKLFHSKCRLPTVRMQNFAG